MPDQLEPKIPDRFYQVGRQANSVGKYQYESDAEDIEDQVALNMSLAKK